MTTGEIIINDKEWRQLAFAYGDLGDGRFKKGFARGINQTGNKSRTVGIRATSSALSLPQKLVRPKFKTFPAMPNFLSYKLFVSDKFISLYKLGGAKQGGSGTSVKYWGHHKGAFIATMPSGHTGVFVRTGKKRLPIKELWGPNVATAFRDHGLAPFFATANSLLIPNIYSRMDGMIRQTGRRRGLM